MTPELRELFPITKRAIYLNHAAVSPLPTPTLEAIETQLKDVHENGMLNFRNWLATKERTRKLIADLLGARPEAYGGRDGAAGAGARAGDRHVHPRRGGDAEARAAADPDLEVGGRGERFESSSTAQSVARLAPRIPRACRARPEVRWTSR